MLKINKVLKSQHATKQRDTEEEEKISRSHRGRCPKLTVSMWQGLCDGSWLFPQQCQHQAAAGRMVPVLPFLPYCGSSGRWRGTVPQCHRLQRTMVTKQSVFTLAKQ